jgi:CMP-N,N'-diacetyllegionaminic acid synthase
MRKVAVITARAGSKGVPGKNSKNLFEKPLVLWTINQAIASGAFDLILLSTDDLAIAEIGKSAGVSVPFLRPASLATDDASSVEVVLHAGSYLGLNPEDIICLLEPTSPLRCPEDIPNTINLLLNEEIRYESAISVGQVKSHPYTTFTVSGDFLAANYPELNKLRRQDLPEVFHPYGGIYATRFEYLSRTKTFYPPRLGMNMLRPLQSLEIDDLDDFELADLLIRKYLHSDGIHIVISDIRNV